MGPCAKNFEKKMPKSKYERDSLTPWIKITQDGFKYLYFFKVGRVKVNC